MSGTWHATSLSTARVIATSPARHDTAVRPAVAQMLGRISVRGRDSRREPTHNHGPPARAAQDACAVLRVHEQRQKKQSIPAPCSINHTPITRESHENQE